ncbi:MAG: B12-binding domain-containing radical SAM protein [Pseudodesulfovibrio sp.]|uniref:Radical SAM domain protein n=1 Tax=Pseudodesulfovibrio aespoeensis (strain ATCC 700646 / DSM 10631 / Aspo-2) TaxID=643562 RepID=E6VZL2_PSEA9|nr:MULTISPECIES: radical SAM protein [Pseudodesulfovibrio]MBU4475997.1 B12-binding domain-containing radical SAM protein [Pseudomonadota bacterium]ADU61726.1 Radical SAM domain protein [Pseudodesulfovibrio aespoeensis Aspo-2]MBU4515770.1 B12-binding domain-containing radical SAM protein [Pseudomonadota bacterium]MBU4520764.1 B12-binding domain-containing radical SAM protein [Pseudomonadota bacterium]MBU4557640.1 B12-binding domain-containing radical SAM protein [Pseudomonadota bacterium]
MGASKLLIVNPSCPGWPEWPVGMAYVLACLEQRGIPFDLIDLARVENWEKSLAAALDSDRYLAVASGGLIGDYRFFRRLRELAGKKSPDTPFVLGGNITKDGNDRLLFDIIGVDYAILGEAETSLPAFVEGLRAGREDFHGYDGVIFREKATGQVVRNKFKRLDLKRHKVRPAWHHFDCDYFITMSSFPFMGGGLRSMPVLSGRGCVGKCGFCSPSIGGFRKREIADLIDEIRFLIREYDFDKLCFLNEMFYPTAREVREFCAAYAALETRKPWFVQVRIDAGLDAETLVMMKEAGCIAVSAGIESGSDDVLAAMNKKTTAEQIRTFFRNCKAAGMPSNGTFIIGYDGETAEDLRKTIDLLIEEDISSGDALLVAYQGTKVYRKALGAGLIEDEDKHLDDFCCDIFAPDAYSRFCNMTAMSTDEFFDLAPKEVRRYNTYVFDKYKVRDLSLTIDGNWRWTSVLLEGKCRECGAPVRERFLAYGAEFLGLLGIGMSRNTFCGHCFKPLAFDIFEAGEMPEGRAHVREVSKALARYRRILVCAPTNDVNFLLRINFLSLDYELIHGIYLYRDEPVGRYLKYPVLKEGEIVGSGADCLLCFDVDAGASVRRLYARLGRECPPVVHAHPEAFRRSVAAKVPHAYRINQVFKRLFGVSVRTVLDRARALVGR